MKLFKKFRSPKKDKKQETRDLQIEYLELKDMKSGRQVEELVKEYGEQISEASREAEKIKREYQLVLSCLSDIQEIKQMPPHIQTEIMDNSREIQRINRERKNFQSKEIRISDSQYLHIRQYEEEIPGVIRDFKQKEGYLSKVKRDLEYLEGEKGALTYTRKELLQSQQNMKGIAIISFVTLVVLILILMAVQVSHGMNVQIGFLATIFVAGMITISVFVKMRSNTYHLKRTIQRINKTIQLLNKTKIKFVNSTNEADYLYEKYRVNSSYELIYLWEEYKKAKREREYYSLTSKDLEFHLGELGAILKNFNISEPSVWLNQPETFADYKMMEDMIEGLKKRRDHLKERLAYNMELAEEGKKRISELIEHNKKNAKKILDIVNSIEE